MEMPAWQLQHDTLCVIPVRGGSIRIPRKNSLPLGGKPLLLWTLDEVTHLPPAVRCVVSSEDEEFLAMAQHAGIMAVERPVSLAQADTPTEAVVLDVLDRLHNWWKWVMVLQVTSPFRTCKDVQALLQLRDLDSSVDSLVTVRAGATTGAAGSYGIGTGSGSYAGLIPNGAIYCVRTSVVQGRGQLYGDRLAWYAMHDWCSIDIDTWADIAMAEGILTKLKWHEMRHKGLLLCGRESNGSLIA